MIKKKKERLNHVVYHSSKSQNEFVKLLTEETCKEVIFTINKLLFYIIVVDMIHKHILPLIIKIINDNSLLYKTFLKL